MVKACLSIIKSNLPNLAFDKVEIGFELSIKSLIQTLLLSVISNVKLTKVIIDNFISQKWNAIFNILLQMITLGEAQLNSLFDEIVSKSISF